MSSHADSDLCVITLGLTIACSISSIISRALSTSLPHIESRALNVLTLGRTPDPTISPYLKERRKDGQTGKERRTTRYQGRKRGREGGRKGGGKKGKGEKGKKETKEERKEQRKEGRKM